jgi:hypothetical protein
MNRWYLEYGSDDLLQRSLELNEVYDRILPRSMPMAPSYTSRSLILGSSHFFTRLLLNLRRIRLLLLCSWSSVQCAMKYCISVWASQKKVRDFLAFTDLNLELGEPKASNIQSSMILPVKAAVRIFLESKELINCHRPLKNLQSF